MKEWVGQIGTDRWKVHSQGGQDGIIEDIFSNIDTVNDPPFCVEFGFNHPALVGGTGSNVAHLVLHKGWDSLLLDGDYQNESINLHKHFLTPENIVSVFKQYNVPEEPEFVSIDVDSTDLWLMKAILEEYRPLVLSVEYNCHFPLDAAITFPNDPDERFEVDRAYGASLAALKIVGEENGYSLVYVEKKCDAFFVRNDLIDDGSGELCPPMETWSECVDIPAHPILKRPSRACIFVDYEEFTKTGDLAASQQKATPVAIKYLVEKVGNWQWTPPPRKRTDFTPYNHTTES